MAIFMKVGPVGGDDDALAILGNVSQEGHVDWINVEQLDFKALSKDADTPGARRGGNANGDASGDGDTDHGVTLTKLFDYATTGLIEWGRTRERYDVVINCVREKGQVFMSFRLTEVMLTRYQSAATDEEVRETIDLQYKQLTLESQSYDKQGEPFGFNAATTTVESRFSRVSTQIAGSGGPGADHEGALAGSAIAATSAVAGTGGLAGNGTSGVAGSALGGSAVAHETVDPNYDGLALSHESVQEDRELVVDDVNQIPFELESFEGAEELSRPYEFVLQVISADAHLAAEDLVGQDVSFRVIDHQDIHDDEARDPREFHGVCREVLLGPVLDGARRYTLVVVPKLWLLHQRTNCRIFPKKTINQITDKIFEEHGIDAFDHSKAAAGDVEIPYCVQYRESDFDFLSRLWEEAGIFYFFEFAEGEHRMVLADSKVAYQQAEPRDVQQTSGSVDGPQIRGWSKRVRMVPTKTSYREYNFETPTDTLDAEAESVVTGIGNDAFEVYDYPGRYDAVEPGRERAKMRVEQEEATHCVVEATSTCEWLFAGSKFRLSHHDDSSEENQEYAVVRIRHSAKQLPSDVKVRIRYTNRFFAIPKETTYRPPRRTPRPIVHGPQTAVVVGTSGEEIETDEYGRVKVQFHWDREGQYDENSSCWIRVAQLGAGSQYGTMLIPRVGWEVVVEFEEGDPDRPLVTGCVYNAEKMPPYELPGNKTRTVFKTRSTKEGSAETFNELYFEDKKDEELVYLHAQKDMQRVVENDETIEVGTDGEGSQTVTIQKDQTVTVVAGDRTTTIEQGGDTLDVQTGDRTTTIGQGSDTLTISQGDRTLELSQGSETITLSQGDRTITLSMGSQTTEASAGEVNTEAMMGIELKVGESSIKLDQTGVTISGMMVTVEGTTQTEIKGLMTEIKGDAMLKAGGGITMIG